MTGPFGSWDKKMLLVLACVCIGGCSSSSGNSAALADANPVNRSNGAPVEQVKGKSGPVARLAAVPSPIKADTSTGLAKSVENAQPLDLPESNAATDAPPFPAEVTAFMVDRDGCDHFRGEEPYDAERAAYLEQSVRELCKGSDEKLIQLRRRYAAEPDVVVALSHYEDRIETPIAH